MALAFPDIQCRYFLLASGHCWPFLRQRRLQLFTSFLLSFFKTIGVVVNSNDPFLIAYLKHTRARSHNNTHSHTHALTIRNTRRCTASRRFSLDQFKVQSLYFYTFPLNNLVFRYICTQRVCFAPPPALAFLMPSLPLCARQHLQLCSSLRYCCERASHIKFAFAGYVNTGMEPTTFAVVLIAW